MGPRVRLEPKLGPVTDSTWLCSDYNRLGGATVARDNQPLNQNGLRNLSISLWMLVDTGTDRNFLLGYC